MKNESKKRLFLLETKGLGQFYVIASDASQAEYQLMKMFSCADYGFTDARKVQNIKILADEIYSFPEDKPFFSSKNNLIIVDNWTE